MKKYKDVLVGLVLCGLFLLSLQLLFGTMCLAKLFTGFPCPGCGLTRAGFFFFQGRFLESLHMNAFFMLGLLFLFVGIVIKKLLKKNSLFINTYVIIVLVLFFIYYGYRMYHYFPETEPLTYWKGCFLEQIRRLLEQ